MTELSVLYIHPLRFNVIHEECYYNYYIVVMADFVGITVVPYKAFLYSTALPPPGARFIIHVSLRSLFIQQYH